MLPTLSVAVASGLVACVTCLNRLFKREVLGVTSDLLRHTGRAEGDREGGFTVDLVGGVVGTNS